MLGAGGIETKHQDNLKVKLAFDFTPQWRLTYTLGIFQNDIKSAVDTYLRNAAGAPVYSGSVNIGGFNYNLGAGTFSSSSGQYNWSQEHTSQSLALKSDTGGKWDWEAAASRYDYGRDQLRIPGTALPAAQNGGAGTMVSLNGTGWTTLDLKGYWRPGDVAGAHQVSFGTHYDQYVLANNTYATADWIAGPAGATTAMLRRQDPHRRVLAAGCVALRAAIQADSGVHGRSPGAPSMASIFRPRRPPASTSPRSARRNSPPRRR